MSNANKQGLFAALAETPDNLWGWCCLHDILEDEDAPPEVLRVCRQAGTWIGSREDWEREGPVVVDRVPVARVWVLDMAPKEPTQHKIHWRWFQAYSANLIGSEDVPERWKKGRWNCMEFTTVSNAQAWLTQIALDYARRVRDEGKKEVAV